MNGELKSTFHATFVCFLAYGFWGVFSNSLSQHICPPVLGPRDLHGFSLRCVISGRAATEMREMEAQAGPGCETGRTGSNKRMGRNCI